MKTQAMVDDYFLGETKTVPNNFLLPLLVYHQALDADAHDLAGEWEELFTSHDWIPAWRFGIYDFVHYHSTAHEVLGVFSGRAVVRFGDVDGVDISLQAGDAVVIPAGVSHQCLKASADFCCVGAYPRGQKADLLRADPAAKRAAFARIDNVPLPDLDPVLGEEGPLQDLW